MKNARPLISLPVVTATAICLIFCASCFTVSYSTKGASIPAEVKTFSVQYFDNQADIVESGLSQKVTDDLKDYVQHNTSLTLINNEVGDVDFEGAITDYTVRPVSITANEEAAKNRFSITIRVVYTCFSQPDLSYEESFSRYEDYLSENDFESVKDDLTENIMKLLIEDIFNRAFVNW